MSQDSPSPDDAVHEPVRSAADCCWTQMPEEDCRQFDGKPIEFFIVAEGKYLEGTGTLDTFSHPSQPGLCRLGIVVPVPGSAARCEVYLPPDVVAMITEARWDKSRFVLRMSDGSD